MFQKFVIFLFFLLTPPAIQAQEGSSTSKNEETESAKKETSVEVEKVESVTVEWFQPELGETAKKGRTRVILTGKTLPNSKVYIPKKTIPIITKDKKIMYYKRSKALVSKKIPRADGHGYFQMQLDLPRANIQLPIKIVATKVNGQPKIKSKNFTLNLKVKGEDIKVASKEALKISPAFRKPFSVWAGVGANFLQFSQGRTVTGDTSDSDLSFQTFKSPSLFFKFLWRINPKWDTTFVYKSSPGGVTSSDTINIDNGSYKWNILAIEGSYYPDKWWGSFLNLDSHVGLRFGLQSHSVPFIKYVSGTTTKTYEIKNNSVNMLTMGGYWFLDSRKWSYELFMRYQYPVLVGSLFELTPSFSFDGSLGFYYKFKKSWRVGGFWYGQYHKYNYKATRIDSLLVEGAKSLFFSNLDVRVGFEF